MEDYEGVDFLRRQREQSLLPNALRPGKFTTVNGKYSKVGACLEVSIHAVPLYHK
jgi:hypothetical protein